VWQQDIKSHTQQEKIPVAAAAAVAGSGSALDPGEMWAENEESKVGAGPVRSVHYHYLGSDPHNLVKAESQER